MHVHLLANCMHAQGDGEGVLMEEEREESSELESDEEERERRQKRARYMIYRDFSSRDLTELIYGVA